MTSKLDDRQLSQALAMLPSWRMDASGAAITRDFRFKDFGAAFAFMTQLALFAERHDHHPDWRNVYNRVTVTLSTHDAGGLTQLDIDFAREAEALHGAEAAPTA